MAPINRETKKRVAKHAKLMGLLHSGDFTIVYHDNRSYELYPGKYDEYDEVPFDDVKPVHSADQYLSDGYIPTEVELLVKALGGRAVTI